jgi:hypothetical protein
VDRLEFLNDGGAYHWWTLDNFEYSAIPEPGTMLAGALLLIPVIPSATRLLRKWRKTRTA